MPVDITSGHKLRRDEQVTALDPQLINTAIESQLKWLHTAIPGIIDKFDPEKQTVEVKPAIMTAVMLDPLPANLNPDPNAPRAKWVERPVYVDVPVVFPGNSDFSLTFPIKHGDECLLVFGERCIDNWYAKGGVQEQWELRRHDASDAIAIMGLRSQPHVVKEFDADNMQLRTADGKTVVTLNGGGRVTVGVSGTTMIVEDGTVTIKADAIKLDGNVEVTGVLNGDKTGHFSDDVTAGTVSLKTHIHTGVQSGPSTSGPPQP